LAYIVKRIASCDLIGPGLNGLNIVEHLGSKRMSWIWKRWLRIEANGLIIVLLRSLTRNTVYFYHIKISGLVIQLFDWGIEDTVWRIGNMVNPYIAEAVSIVLF
jgi:hypothetical protein